MGSFSGSSTCKLLGAAIWATLFFVVALQVPSSMAARPLPAGVDEATPEWPCCRQYDGPPGALPAEETDEVAVSEPIAVIPAVVATGSPATANLSAEEGADTDVSESAEESLQAGGDVDETDAAQPEWPCCRQYDGPPARSEGLNN